VDLNEFKQLGPNKAESLKGFLVLSIDRHYLGYHDGGRLLKIEVEDGRKPNGQYNLSVYALSIKNWQPPYDNVKITLEKRKEIADNVSRALTFLKTNHTIVW